MAPRAATFHRFSDFPMEIQLLIWEEAVMDDKRIVPVRRDCRAVFVTQELLGPPKFFLVCQASLTAARRFYNLRLRFRHPSGGPGSLRLSTTSDVFLIKNWDAYIWMNRLNQHKFCQTDEWLTLAEIGKIRHILDDSLMPQDENIRITSLRPGPSSVQLNEPGYAAPEKGHEDIAGRPLFELLLAPNALLKSHTLVKLLPQRFGQA